MEMKVLFVERKLRMEKLGVCYLAAALKKAGHKVDLIQDIEDNADDYLNANPADFVMYSVCSDEADWFHKRNQELKANHHFISVVGGPDPTFMPSSYWIKDDVVDYIVQGPGENVILNIVNGSAPRLSRGDLLGKFEYFSPDRSIVYKYDEFGKARMKRFIASRYCLFSCRHCFNHAFKKMFKEQKDCFTYRPEPEIMLQEIIEVKKNYGLELACFNDDDIAGDQNWITKFCELLLRADAPVGFYAPVRATSLNAEIAKIMARAKCRFLNMGVESANSETQKLLRRGPITNDDIFRAVRLCEEIGIKVRLLNMIGLPVDDPLADALETFEFNKECRATASTAAIYQPLPGTELFQYCIKKGLVGADTKPAGFFGKTVLRIKDAEKINRLGKIWHWAFKEKWPLSFLRERLDGPLSDEAMEKMAQAIFEDCKKELYSL